jgi:hypothetical protein
MYTRLLPAIFFLLLSACSPEQQTGPGKIRWDRETCTRCNMAVGDRYFAAQIRGGAEGEKSSLYKFDDIGCAVIWLQKQSWKDDAGTEIWVTDYRNGQWLDARRAGYVKDKLTPMNYGLGALSREPDSTHNEAAAAVLDYSQAVAHIMTSEKEKHQHGGRMHMGRE